MERGRLFVGIVFALALLTCLVSEAPAQTKVLKDFPLNSLDGVVTRSGVSLDKGMSSDGKGSLRIVVKKPRVVKLFEMGDVDVEDARLLYKAKLRTEDLDGHAYLEMWVSIPGKGEFFSRGLQNPLSGTTDWKSVETPFFLKEGQNPDKVKLNVVVNGKGTVWIDDIKLEKTPPQ
ncbi:hypothetical protein ACFL2Q_01495 [Thermodesulfobacteriota bacterium]